MKKHILSALAGAACTLLILFSVVIFRENHNNRERDYNYTSFTSSISTEDCFICGNSIRSILPLYWGQDNVGIINLNTLEILPLEINRYDDTNQLITEKAGYMQHNTIGDKEAYAYAAVFPDEGYADIRISGAENGVNRKHVEDSFCQTCLNEINDLNNENKPFSEFVVINFSEKTIHPLLETHSWFSSGNYGVSCNFEDDGKIDLLIHLLRTGF